MKMLRILVYAVLTLGLFACSQNPSPAPAQQPPPQSKVNATPVIVLADPKLSKQVWEGVRVEMRAQKDAIEVVRDRYPFQGIGIRWQVEARNDGEMVGVITGLYAGGPAHIAGLRPGDFIRTVNGASCKSQDLEPRSCINFLVGAIRGLAHREADIPLEIEQDGERMPLVLRATAIGEDFRKRVDAAMPVWNAWFEGVEREIDALESRHEKLANDDWEALNALRSDYLTLSRKLRDESPNEEFDRLYADLFIQQDPHFEDP